MTTKTPRPKLTHYTLLDRYNPNPLLRGLKRSALLLHRWHTLQRGQPVPRVRFGTSDGVIVGFFRGRGGMYLMYGPTVNDVSGWNLIKASAAQHQK